MTDKSIRTSYEIVHMDNRACKSIERVIIITLYHRILINASLRHLMELDRSRNKDSQGLTKAVASFKAELEKAGGKLIVEYYTMGQYDGIVIVEAPTDDTIMSIMLSDASKGNFRSISLKAFPVSEASKTIEKISPSRSD